MTTLKLTDKSNMFNLAVGEHMVGGYCSECKVKGIVKRVSQDMWTIKCQCQIKFISSKGYVTSRGLDKGEYESWKKETSTKS